MPLGSWSLQRCTTPERLWHRRKTLVMLLGREDGAAGAARTYLSRLDSRCYTAVRLMEGLYGAFPASCGLFLQFITDPIFVAGC